MLRATLSALVAATLTLVSAKKYAGPPQVNITASLISPDTAKICFYGPATTTSSWIGFGIPEPGGGHEMINAELFLAFIDPANGKNVTLHYGNGIKGPVEEEFVKGDSGSAGVSFIASESSITNNVLTACISRPLKYTTPDKFQHQLDLNTTSVYIWATGSLSSSGVPLPHAIYGYEEVVLSKLVKGSNGTAEPGTSSLKSKADMSHVVYGGFGCIVSLFGFAMLWMA